MYVYTRLHICTYRHRCTRRPILVYAYHVYTYVYVLQTYTYIYTCTHAPTIHSCIYTCLHSIHIYRNVYKHAYMYTHYLYTLHAKYMLPNSYSCPYQTCTCSFAHVLGFINTEKGSPQYVFYKPPSFFSGLNLQQHMSLSYPFPRTTCHSVCPCWSNHLLLISAWAAPFPACGRWGCSHAEGLCHQPVRGSEAHGHLLVSHTLYLKTTQRLHQKCAQNFLHLLHKLPQNPLNL